MRAQNASRSCGADSDLLAGRPSPPRARPIWHAHAEGATYRRSDPTLACTRCSMRSHMAADVGFWDRGPTRLLTKPAAGTGTATIVQYDKNIFRTTIQ